MESLSIKRQQLVLYLIRLRFGRCDRGWVDVTVGWVEVTILYTQSLRVQADLSAEIEKYQTPAACTLFDTSSLRSM